MNDDIRTYKGYRITAYAVPLDDSKNFHAEYHLSRPVGGGEDDEHPNYPVRAEGVDIEFVSEDEAKANAYDAARQEIDSRNK